MSHELRTPLNAIIGFADLLHAEKVPVGSPKQKIFVDHIRTSGRHLLRLINDILDLSKVEAGKFEFFPESVALHELTGEVVDVLAEQARAKSIRVGITIEPQVTRVVVDPQRLRQILFNYLSNALKFTPAGGTVQVRASAESDRFWRLEVEDSGIGIQPQDIGRLFTEFQQLDGGLTKKHGGTGLGLALTRRLVEAQGGSVGVRSMPGERTVFHALLPREALVSSTLAPHAAVSSPAQAHSNDVLVVEDNPADAQRLSDALVAAGFGVSIAATAAEALALTTERRFAAITLDLLLPDQPGLDLLAEIRASDANHDVPVLVISVMSTSVPAPGVAFPVADVLSKPIDTRAVIEALRRSGVVARERDLVLVVDDDRQSRELMSTVLSSAGFAASAYADAAAALAVLPSVRPVAVILDLSMPGYDGFEFLERMRAVPGAAAIPVFVWTSRDLRAHDYERLLGKAERVFQKTRIDVDAVLDHIRWRLGKA
jgi:DNA-binding response OmpR family regulator